MTNSNNNLDLKGLTEQVEKLEQSFKSVKTSVDDAGSSLDSFMKELSEKQAKLGTDLVSKASKSVESAAKSGKKSITDSIKGFANTLLTAAQRLVPLQTLGFIKISDKLGK